jgi:phage tail protein X
MGKSSRLWRCYKLYGHFVAIYSHLVQSWFGMQVYLPIDFMRREAHMRIMEGRAVDRLAWQQYEGKYRSAMYAAVRAANPEWEPGQPFLPEYWTALQGNPFGLITGERVGL